MKGGVHREAQPPQARDACWANGMFCMLWVHSTARDMWADDSEESVKKKKQNVILQNSFVLKNNNKKLPQKQRGRWKAVGETGPEKRPEDDKHIKKNIVYSHIHLFKKSFLSTYYVHPLRIQHRAKQIIPVHTELTVGVTGTEDVT